MWSSFSLIATEATLSVGILGGVVVVVTVLSVTATVIVILILRNRHSTGLKCRKYVELCLSMFATCCL